MGEVAQLQHSKLHFLKRRESEHTLSNGWVVTLRKLSGARKAEIEGLSLEAIPHPKRENAFQFVPRLDRQGEAYALAISDMIVRIKDGDNELENSGKPIFTPAEVGEFDDDIFGELRKIYDGEQVGKPAKKKPG